MLNETSTVSERFRTGLSWFESFRARRAFHNTVRPTRAQIIIWLLVTLVTAGLVLFDFDTFEVGMYNDDAVYTILARSAAETGRFELSYLPEGVKSDLPNFPFGFPLVLVPVVWAFPGNLQALKAVSLVATLINIGLIFWGWPWLSRNTSRWMGVLVMALYGISPLIITHARLIMSEAVFLTACLLGYMFAEQVGRAKTGYGWAISLGVAAIAICLIRSIGIIFVLVFVLDILIAKGRQALKPLSVTLATPLALLVLLLALTPARANDLIAPLIRYGNEYQQFSSGVKTSPNVSNFSFPAFLAQQAYVHIFRDMRGTIFAVGGGEREAVFWSQRGLPFLSDSIGWVVSTLALAGIAIVLWREGGSAFSISALMYLTVILLWNWAGTRLFYPILPQLLLGTLVSSEVIARLVQRLIPGLNRYRWLSAATVGLVAVVIAAGFLYRTFKIEPSQLHAGSMEARTDWIRLYAEPDAILMSELPYVDYLYSGRLGVATPPRPNHITTEARLVSFMRANQVDYVLVAPFVGWREVYSIEYSTRIRALIPLLATLESKGRVQLVAESVEHGIRVYRVLK